MADNSTWLSITNRILRQRGLPEISSAQAFDQPGSGLMTRYQSAARELVAIIHEMISVDLPVQFARRRFDLNVDNIQGAIAPLDSGMSVESLTFDSFRNITAGLGGPLKLRNMTYEYFSANYDVSAIPSAPPTHYILLPIERTETGAVYRVRIYPNPDRAYNLEYIAQLNAYSLQASGDQILWPPNYEHALIMECVAALEDLLGEGKGGSAYQIAARAVAKVRQKATAPRAERRGVRMKQLFGRGRNGYYYDSPDDGESYPARPGIR